jgi:hypothetical protein
MSVKAPIEPGEWVDPSIPLPDHPLRKTWWWALFNRAPRPFLWWVTNAIWVSIAWNAWYSQFPPDAFLYALMAWTAALFGVSTYEKRLGIA